MIMMSKLTVSALALILSLALMVQLGESKVLDADKSSSSNTANIQIKNMHQQSKDEAVEALLMRKLLRELTSPAEEDGQDEQDEDDSSAEVEIDFVKRGIEK